MRKQYIHFFSYVSHVSLELPVIWQESTETETSVIYTFSLENLPEYEGYTIPSVNKPRDPIFAIQLIALKNPEAGELANIADAFLHQKRERISVINRNTQLVDGYDAIVISFNSDNQEQTGRNYELQSFIIIDDVLFSISAVAPEFMQPVFAKDFDNALKSIRFIFFD
ncbi:MAG: hypothetical protein ACK5CH_06830 [Bacteroidota bacterium]|jgi:hypothetical protein